MKNYTDFDQEFMPKGICQVATAMIGSSIIGGVTAANQASAAKSAARTQAAAATQAAESQLQAAREANQLQWQMYQQQLANQSPYLTGGQQAYAALLGGMGLSAPRVSGQVGQPVQQPGQVQMAPVQAQPDVGRPGLRGGQMPVTPAAAPTFTNAAGQVVDASGQPVLTGYGPIQNYGASQEELERASGTFGGQLAQRFGPANFEQDPSYQFRLNEGLKALQSSAAARGTLMSGQGLKDITNYAQGAASQEYQSAFDRYRAQQGDLYNRLAGLAGVGQTATSAISQAGQQAAGSIGSNILGAQGAASNYLTGGAAAQAAGTVGAANAISGGLNNIAGNFLGYQVYNQAMQPQTQPSPIQPAGSQAFTPNYSLGGSRVRFGGP